MNEEHLSNLRQYINDVIGMEKDIVQAVRVQIDDARVAEFPELRRALADVLRNSQERLEELHQISEEEGGSIGAAIKEGITAVAGTLAGIYGKVREHPVSRMVRDDIIAMDVASTSYGMLLTLGLAVGHEDCAAIAMKGLASCPGLVVRLTDVMPFVIVAELGEDGPLASPAAAQVAHAHIRAAWDFGSGETLPGVG